MEVKDVIYLSVQPSWQPVRSEPLPSSGTHPMHRCPCG